jgi:allantoinase
MAAADLIVRGQNVVTQGAIGPAAIHIRDGVITAVADYDEVPAGVEVFDAGELCVMPGLVDTHVHINEPGRTEWEGFETATQAAAAGGITTLVDMPLNSIPATTTVAALHKKFEAARGKLHVDVGFWGGVVPGNTAELSGLHEAGVFGFKCFLVPSGVPEFPHVDEGQLRLAVSELAPLRTVLLAHAELPGPIEAAAGRRAAISPERYATWLRARPREAENEAIAMLIAVCREFGARVHIVHLSSSDAVPAIRQAREAGLYLTVETCPHYLVLAAEDIPDGATQFKCAPPIREQENAELLWSALREGVIDMVASDHSPCPPEMKETGGDFLRAWGGIASLQMGLSVVWTAMRRRGFSLLHLVHAMCRAPAALAGLVMRKGSIDTGLYADLVVWDPEATFQVEPEKLHHRHKLTPYAGQTLSGVVHTTFVRGKKVYHHGEFAPHPCGSVLMRGWV